LIGGGPNPPYESVNSDYDVEAASESLARKAELAEKTVADAENNKLETIGKITLAENEVTKYKIINREMANQ
jgi:hypothetical protein